VALHEFGHAFGMGHSSIRSAVMYQSYTGQKQALTSDDASGIQAIYGARQPDIYNSGGASNGSFATAADLMSLLDPVALTAVVNNLDLTSTSGAEYFTVTAPPTTSGTLTVDVQSAGLSLLTPAVTVYAADQATVLRSASGAGLYNGANLTVTVNGVTAGQQFHVQVTGADTTQFSTGNFALALNFGSGPTPTATPPNTQLLNGATLSGGGALALAVADMLAVSDQVSESGSFTATGFPHGPGCGCPMCGGTAAQANPMAASAEPQQVNSLASGMRSQLRETIMNAWDSLSQGTTPHGSQAADGYFADPSGWEDALTSSDWDG
jgi:hypothetical protein